MRTEWRRRGWSLLSISVFLLIVAGVFVVLAPVCGLVIGIVAGFFGGVAAMYLDPPWSA